MELAGPARGAEEIDMSLDDIIKRHRKGQRDAKLVGDTRQEQFKNRNSAYGSGRLRFRTWMQRNLQGLSRFRRGFGQQQYNRRQFRSAVAGPRRRAVAKLNGASPLNHQTSPPEGNQEAEAFTKSSDNGQPEAQGQLPQHPKRFQTVGVAGQAAAGRPFTLRRRPAFLQKQPPRRLANFSFPRGRAQPRPGGKGLWMRRWQPQPSSGAVLTVSVSNPQASHATLPGAKRPFLRGRRLPARPARPQPRGVPLRFNFRAMANQTSLTLDERFSGLRNRRRFTAARNSGRTVTLP
ncbi:UAP56-interacting factor-like [Carettochelys insculpta]|uniref:UAP56-interacting factor-like n=1 Tax=Carettochelys insculpta TaxID=44489 RepID=UPI003EBAD3C5